MKGEIKSRRVDKKQREHLSPEKERNLLETERLKHEEERITLERQQIEINLHLEDFKARWQELLSLQNENNRWTTLYVTVLLLVVGWVINNSGQHNSGLGDLYARSDNAYLILSIAVLNALYAFAMAFKGYQIQQIAQYQYEVISQRIRIISKIEFNEWERYRRGQGHKLLRLAYFLLVKSLPIVVSYTIIVQYWHYQWNPQAISDSWKSSRNWFSIAAFILVTFSFIFSLLTLKLGRRWNIILRRREARPQANNAL